MPKLTAQNSTQPDQPIYEHALQRLYGGNSNVFSIAKQQVVCLMEATQ